MVKTVPNLDQGGEEIVNITLSGTTYAYPVTFSQDYPALYWSVRVKKFGQYSQWSLMNGHIPKLSITTQTGVSTTWHAKYFDNHNCTTPGCTTTPRCEEDLATLDKNWGTGAPCGISGNNWGALFTSNFYFPESDYVFHVDHDDGARLFLDGKNIIDVPNNIEANNACPVHHLVGNHRLELIYFENNDNARVKLDWSNDTSLCATTQRDESPPSGKFIEPVSTVSGGYLAFLGVPQGAIKVEASDAGSGVNRVEFVYSTFGTSHKFASVTNPEPGGIYSAQWTDSDFLGDGQYYTFEAWIYDNAGLSHAVPYLDVIIDTNGPTLTPQSPVAGSSAASPNYITQSVIPIEIQADDHWSGVAKVVLQVKYGGSTTWMDVGQDNDPDGGWRVDWQAPEFGQQ